MIIWLVLGVMTAAAIGFVVVPLARRARAAVPRSSYDLEIYRDQLSEIDRDVARGVLAASQAEAARAEIGRRALAVAEEQDPAGPAPGVSPRSQWGAAVAGVAVCVLAGGFYLSVGSPGLPGLPAAERATAAGPDLEARVAQLLARMERNPDDPEGWALLGRALTALSRFDQAATAYGRAVTLRPGDAELLSRHGEALAFAADGVVTPASRAAFEGALKADPKEPRSRYYIGLAAMQAGKTREAFDLWRALETDSAPDAQWLPILRPRIARLATQLGVDLPERQEPPRGPTAEDMRNARSMSPEDRQAMIRSMVAGLAARLEDKPDDFDGWMRLGRSYGVLGERVKSRDAFARAAALRPDSAAALSSHAAAIAQASGGDLGAAPGLAPVLDRLMTLDPDNRVGLWLAGAAAQSAGKLADTRRHWARLLALLPVGTPQYEDLKRQLTALGKAGKP